MRFTILAVLILFQFSVHAQKSPWGTGLISNKVLDTLSKPDLYSSHTGESFDLNDFLKIDSYNMYIPASYDGSKPYGIITFINSGNNGVIFQSWQQVMNEKNLIMVSGNNIGNTVSIHRRSGVALAGLEKLREILNIDTTRIYASGNSGGARSSSALFYFFPEIFTGLVPNCGAIFLRKVDQDYETHQPNSNYEYIYPFTTKELDYVKSFDRKYAIMTSYDDFREGDIMNIYHNGMQPDGFKSKFLETSGPHCTTNAAHFRDAINFIEHPHIDVLKDDFSGVNTVGNGYELDAVVNTSNKLVFNHKDSVIARAYSKNPFTWNHDKGAIFSTSIEIDSNNYKQNTFFNISFLDYSDTNVFYQKIGHKIYPGKANLMLGIQLNGPQPTVYVLAEKSGIPSNGDTLFKGVMKDWTASQPLNIKFHLWNKEIRIEMGKHFQSTPIVGTTVKLLDDKRSIRIRTEGQYWTATDFSSTLLTLVAGKIDLQKSSTELMLDKIQVICTEKLKHITPNPNIKDTTALFNSQFKNDSKNINLIKVVPNPNNGEFTIVTSQPTNTELIITDVSGKMITKIKHNGTDSYLKLNELDRGFYFVIPIEYGSPVKFIVH